MSWNHDIIIYPSKSNLPSFSREISTEKDENLRRIEEMKNLVYASSYLEIRNFFNLYVCIGKIKSRLAYVANLNVSREQLLFKNGFPD